MTVKVSLAAITSTVMALSMQVHAGEKVNVESPDGGEWADQVNNAIRNKESKAAIQMAMVGLSQNIIVNGKESPIDVSVILQSREDSTDVFGSDEMGDPGMSAYTATVAACYTNCHSACHGSRSWR